MESGQWQSRSIEENPDQAIGNKPEISFVKRTVRYNNQLENESYKKPVLVYKKSNVNFDFNDFKNDIRQSYENNDSIENSNLRLKRDLGNEKPQIKHLDREYEFHSKVGDVIDTNNINIKTDKTYVKNEQKTKFKTRQKRSIIDLLQNSYIYWVNKILGLNSNRRTNPPRYKVINGIKYVYHPYRVQKPKMPKEIHMGGTQNQDLKTFVAVEDFNKGEIVEGIPPSTIESRMNKKKFIKMKDSVTDTVEDNPWE